MTFDSSYIEIYTSGKVLLALLQKGNSTSLKKYAILKWSWLGSVRKAKSTISNAGNVADFYLEQNFYLNIQYKLTVRSAPYRNDANFHHPINVFSQLFKDYILDVYTMYQHSGHETVIQLRLSRRLYLLVLRR